MNETKVEAVPASAWDWLLHPVFARVVGPDARRYDLSQPFAIDEYVYATDGKIIVRMPAPGGWSLPNAATVPGRSMVHAVFGDGDDGRDRWRSVPTQFPPVKGACVVCRGQKVLPEVGCPYCGGPDSPRYDGVPDYCEECWELEGKIPAGPCHDCGGTGLLDASGRVEVAPGFHLRRRYVALLHEFDFTTYLPECPFPTTRREWEKLGNRLSVRFTLGDVVGVLMSMFSPDEEPARE